MGWVELDERRVGEGLRVAFERAPNSAPHARIQILGACVGEIRRLRFPAREYKRFEEKEQTGIATDMHPDEILRIEVRRAVGGGGGTRIAGKLLWDFLPLPTCPPPLFG